MRMLGSDRRAHLQELIAMLSDRGITDVGVMMGGVTADDTRAAESRAVILRSRAGERARGLSVGERALWEMRELDGTLDTANDDGVDTPRRGCRSRR